MLRSTLITINKAFVRSHFYYGDILYDQSKTGVYSVWFLLDHSWYNTTTWSASEKELSQELGLESLQWRYWYRNLEIFWILCHVIDFHINFQDFLSHRNEFIVISIRWETCVPQGRNDNFSRKQSIFLMSCFCCIVETFEMIPWKMNPKSYRNGLFRSFSCRMWAVAGEKSKDAITFF